MAKPTPVFKVGDKVKVVEGGWGMHPDHIGQICIIYSVIPSACGDPAYTRYTTIEGFQSRGGSRHIPKSTSVRGETFELVNQGDFAQQIRDINAQLKEKDEQIAVVARDKALLVLERQRLIAALLKELDA
jgi:hypothetical protein